jgi:neurofibromin 1
MFKFYSKVVGIRYLFNNLARYILELERLAARKPEMSGSNSKSLLSMEMEVDPDKFGSSESTFQDSEANLYQLILACQKIFATIRDSIDEIPTQWKDIFRAMKDAVYFKFSSEDAVFKGVGGFLFLRFIGPAITAPHAYGLLEFPPNQRAQRQLVLIGKVIQSLANMQMPGQKELFMQSLNDFFARNIPKMKDFYIALLAYDTFGKPKTQPVEVPDVVVNNCLGWAYGHILTNQAKMRGLLTEKFAPHEAEELKASLDELVERYGDKPPKKLDKKSSTKKKGDDA